MWHVQSQDVFFDFLMNDLNEITLYQNQITRVCKQNPYKKQDMTKINPNHFIFTAI